MPIGSVLRGLRRGIRQFKQQLSQPAVIEVAVDGKANLDKLWRGHKPRRKLGLKESLCESYPLPLWQQQQF